MNSNHETNQFGQGSKIDKQQEQNSEVYKNSIQSASKNQETNDDFLSGDNKSRPYPNEQNSFDEGYNKSFSAGIGTKLNDDTAFETSPEDEDRYNNGTSEHDDLIDNIISEDEAKTRYSSPSRNGSHRNH